jgi:dTDP-glucose pyrophosphorylase
MNGEGSLNIVIPMAGRGSRFAAAGCTIPKYMVEAGGLSLFEHSLSSLPLKLAGKVVFVALREHENDFGVSAFINEKFGRAARRAGSRSGCEVVLLAAPTRGQAETVLCARDCVPPGEEMAIFNIDTGFVSSSLAARLADPAAKKDGVLGAFVLDAPETKWSFAQTDAQGVVTKTAEKEPISRYALTGMYHFTRAGDFYDAAAAAISGSETVRGEYYVAPLYNRLIAKGRRFVLDVAERIIPLGTPEDVKNYGR